LGVGEGEFDAEEDGMAEVDADKVELEVVIGTEVSSGASSAGGASPFSRFFTRPMIPRRAGSGFRASVHIHAHAIVITIDQSRGREDIYQMWCMMHDRR